jgi:hypothetical protein
MCPEAFVREDDGMKRILGSVGILVGLAHSVPGQDVAQAPNYQTVMFSVEYTNEFQSRSFTFTVARTFYRVPWEATVPLFSQDESGYVYQCFRIQNPPHAGTCLVVFGLPLSHRRVHSYLAFSPTLGADGTLVDPLWFRIENLSGDDFGQMIEREPR